MIKNVFWKFEFLIAALQIAINRMLSAIMQPCLLQRFEAMRTIVARHVEEFANFGVVITANLCWSNSQR